ncbi:MAG TPA: DinB family protein, partial [Vicinamibacteria bacterium]
AARAEQDEARDRDAASLLAEVGAAVDRALAQLRATPRETLLAPRPVGRAGAPSTVLGLLVHAAEHAQRHAGQVITTARILRGSSS